VGQARRPDPGPGTTDRSQLGVHHRPRPRCGVLAVAAHPQTGPAERHHANAGIASLEIVVDTREQYAYRFASQQVTTVKRALPCGDYGVTVDGRLVAVVERKSLADLVFSLINGKLRYALGDLAALPRAAVVVEDRYSQVFKLDWARPAVVADGLAELQIRWPSVPIVFSEARQLAAAHAWASTALALAERSG
jgi:ERCC4-type nuclease